MSIHPTVIIEAGAEIGTGVSIGAYSVIGPHVRIGNDTELAPHVVIEGHTELGESNRISSFATLGVPPQDLKYKGAPTRLVIGSNNVIRENANISTGTEDGGGVTTIGDSNLIMAYCHIAHDCHVANHVIMSNAATLGGHVEIQEHAIVGAFSGVHQFCRVGQHSFVGGYSVVTKDALPYFKTVGNRARVFGVNTIGLKRQGFDDEAIACIRDAYRILFQSRQNTSQAVACLKREMGGVGEIDVLIRFIESSERGVVKR